MALQCPRCELRFDLKPMLADHLATDHGADPAVTDPLQPPSRRAGMVAAEEDRRAAEGREGGDR